MTNLADAGVLESIGSSPGGRRRRASSSRPASTAYVSATASRATRATRAPSTPGCACTATMPSRRPTAPMHGSPQATRRSSAAFPSGSRISTPLPASRSRRRAGCSTRCRSGRARPGCGSRRPEWCCSVTCTRTSSRRAERPIRSATRGRSTARRAGRAAVRRLRSRRGWSRPRRARTPRDRCASLPRSAARRRSSRRGERCRRAAWCRSRRPSTTPGRWRAAWRTASRCSPR